MRYIPRTCSTVRRLDEMGSSMPLTRFLASSETRGQGSLRKFNSPFIIACAIPSSVSVLVIYKELHEVYHQIYFNFNIKNRINVSFLPAQKGGTPHNNM